MTKKRYPRRNTETFKTKDQFTRTIENAKIAIGNFFWGNLQIIFCIVVSIGFILILIPFNIADWIEYNTYSTANQLWGDNIYCYYFIEYFLFFRIVFVLIIGFGIYCTIKDLKEKTTSKKRKLIKALIFLPILIGTLYGLYCSVLLDLKYVINDECFVTESDLSRYRVIYRRGIRGGTRTHYYLYLYETINENSQDNNGIIKSRRQIDNRKIYLDDDYKKLDLNYYQYLDLQHLYLKDSLKNSTNPSKLKVYYLPNTKMVLRYEILN